MSSATFATSRLILVIFSVAALERGVAFVAPPQAHTMTSPESLKWEPAGAPISRAVLSGSPDTEGSPFVIRIKMADGVKVPPHWHPVDEHLTVISGTFHMGVGEKFDESLATAMRPGSYSVMPKEVRHYAWATGETIVQLHGVGPFKTVFVGQATTK